ncbi:NmrA family NAD(P)-binding protein [Sphingomonas lycopersici]|uniref:NmrA family NAD(P)-binding protein n=1 Tax=Sphingomonas lycopersici TaxID=2951807 RepID=A0AA41Z6F8_9SPHN|nr:NmrA family NAD(P)-binding protein [Sphingomonas lycopersici]MCW6533699.1 NmrA family NAD(P)-binding protein [Sphingomonas lycopersici]
MTSVPRIFVIGATGAQGLPVVRGLVADGRYSVVALTRDARSARARTLAAMGDVSFLEGSFADEAVLREGLRAADGVFVNIDGFNAGEKTEMYWAIRCYETAVEEGVKFFVYGNLDYTLKKAGYRSTFRTGHYDGKGRIGEWILDQNRSNGDRMGAALFTTGPYIEMAFSSQTPMTPRIEDGVLTWRVPLGAGAVVHVALEDCGHYVRWLFDNQDRANGMDLEVAIEHVRYADLAAAFERVTGHPARFVDTDLDSYFAPIQTIASMPAGYNADPNDKATMSFRDNFTGFWNQWKHDIIQRNYALLDEIHPHRIRSAEEWMRREEQRAKETGGLTLWERMQPENLSKRPILKLSEDQRRGAL